MHGRLALGAGMLFGLAYDANRRAAQAELDNPPMGRMIDLSDGSRLHYVERGSGPPVLLIHGLTDDNVYAQHSMQLADAWFNAGKTFTFVPLLGTHMVSEPVLRLRRQARIMEFFDGVLKK